MKDTYYILIKVPIGKSDQYSPSVDTWTGLIKDHNLLLPRSNIVKTQQLLKNSKMVSTIKVPISKSDQ